MPKKSQVSDITIDFSGSGQGARSLSPEAEREFAKLYRQQKGGDLPALVRAARKRRLWTYLIVVLAFVLGISSAWFFLSGRGQKFGEDAVHVELVAPASGPSGQAVEYQLTYQNDQAVALTQAEVNVRYPDGFTFQSALPAAQNAEGTSFVVGNIAARASGTITIRGQLAGEVGAEKKVTAVLTYEPETFKAQFAKTVDATTQLVASVVNLDVASPAQLPIDEPLTLALTYHNSSTTTLSGLLLRLTAPTGFTLDVPKLAAWNSSASTWQLPDVAPRADGTLNLTGKFTDTAQAGQQEFHLAVGFASPSGQDITVQQEKVVTVALVQSHLTLSLTANGASVSSAVDLGSSVAYELSFVNEGDTPFGDVALTATVDSRFFDWSSFKDDSLGTVNPAAGTVTWNKSNLPFLAALGPGIRGTIRFSLSLQPGIPTGLTPPLQFSAKVAAQATETAGAAPHTVNATSNEVVSKVNTKFTLETEGHYYTDELVKVGSGPLPPQVGQTTTYVILWRLANTLNEVDNVVVTTTLPAGVTWTGQATVSAGQQLTYNPNTQEVRWQLNRLPAGAGAAFPKPEASFEVAITPQPADADKILVLSRTATATATDSSTNGNLISSGKLITTELDDDLAAQGKGVVVP